MWGLYSSVSGVISYVTCQLISCYMFLKSIYHLSCMGIISHLLTYGFTSSHLSCVIVIVFHACVYVTTIMRVDVKSSSVTRVCFEKSAVIYLCLVVFHAFLYKVISFHVYLCQFISVPCLVCIIIIYHFCKFIHRCTYAVQH